MLPTPCATCSCNITAHNPSGVSLPLFVSFTTGPSSSAPSPLPPPPTTSPSPPPPTTPASPAPPSPPPQPPVVPPPQPTLLSLPSVTNTTAVLTLGSIVAGTAYPINCTNVASNSQYQYTYNTKFTALTVVISDLEPGTNFT